MNPKYFKPELSKPYTIALKYPTGKQVTGFSGPELRWILSDGQAFYTSLDFGRKIEDLGIRVGQVFQIEKRVVERKAEWFVNRVPDLQPKPGLPQKVATLLAEAGPLDAPHGLDEANLQPVPKRPETELEFALKTAVSAAAEAERHGGAKVLRF
jgi:hypothetical protein